jgi:hypothetical protein
MMRVRTQRAVSVALSLALHALLLLSLWGSTLARPGGIEPQALPVRIVEPPAASQQPPASAPAPQEVAKAPPAEAPPPAPEAPQPEPPPQPENKLPLPEQIVSPPDAGKNEVPPDTRFRSDRDVRVEQEQVKRGEPKPGEPGPGEDVPPEPVELPKPAAPSKPAPAPAQPAARGRASRPATRQQPPQAAALPDLGRLLPDALVLAQQGYGDSAATMEGSAEQQASRPLTGGGGGGILIPTGPTGTLDYLPDVREGDITLLNTKAEVFAPFVRRVAVRVFQNQMILLRKEVGGASAMESVQAEAVMDPRSGDMIGFTIVNRSARISLGSDRRLREACELGFFDRNPPPGARAADGKIHFVLFSELEYVSTPRGSGYYARFAAGLK